MNGRLIVTRGLPGSGKSTWARAYLTDHPGAVRVNRDELRDMLHGTRTLNPTRELRVTLAQHATVRALLTAGHTVIVDDTNLNPNVITQWGTLARRCCSPLTIRDFTRVPVAECIRRDATRTGPAHVGADVITTLAHRWLSTGSNR